jgi:hypothetical protein
VGVDAGGVCTGAWATVRLLETMTESASSTGTNKQADREFKILPIGDRLNISRLSKLAVMTIRNLQFAIRTL